MWQISNDSETFKLRGCYNKCLKKTTVTPTQIIQKICLLTCVWGEKGREWKLSGVKVNPRVCRFKISVNLESYGKAIVKFLIAGFYVKYNVQRNQRLCMLTVPCSKKYFRLITVSKMLQII